MAHIEYHDVRILCAALADGEVAGNHRIGPHDGVSTMWARDAYNSSGFVSGAWEFGATPVASRDYEVGTMRLRTPRNAGNVTFPGKSLRITGGELNMDATGSRTVTIGDLRLNDGATIGAYTSAGTQTLAGNITVGNNTNSTIRGDTGLIISAPISGGVAGGITYVYNGTTLTGNNSNYLGATIIGDGRFSTLKISSETNLGGNPTFYGGEWLQLNRGILETTATMTIDDPNRGIMIQPSAGFFRPAAGTTLTVAVPVNSPAAGNTLQTAPLDSNPISGMLFKDGSGMLVLTNPNNSHNGEMHILQGEMRIDGAGRLNNGDHWMPVTLNSTFHYNSTANQILRGAISGNGSLVKNNTGTLGINGSNPFTGSVTVNAGTLHANPGNAATNRAFSHASGITVNNGGTLRAGANGLFGWDGTQAKPVTVNAGGTLTTDAANTDVNIGTITLNGGTLAGFSSPAWGSWNFKRVAGAKLLVTENSTVSAPNVGLGASNAIDIAANKTLAYGGAITNLSNEGVCALTRSGGPGTLILTGANTYTGATSLETGTTLVNGSLGNTALTVASAATLGGNGNITGATTIHGTHAPGASAGTQSFGSTLDYGASSRLKWELTSNAASPGTFDKVTAGGAVAIASGAKIDVVLNAPGSGVALDDTFWTQPRSWTFLTGASISGSFTLGTVSNDPGGRNVSDHGTLSLQQNATSATLVFTPYTPTELWRQANFGEDWDDPAIAGDEVDGDMDGLANLLEYALGTDPNVFDPLPDGAIDGGKLRIAFTRNAAAADLTLSVAAADDLASAWTEIARSENGAPFMATVPEASVNESGDGDIKNVQVTDIHLTTDPAHPKRFMRVEAGR